MVKAKYWVGVLALLLLIVQSTFGIMNYSQSSNQGFPRDMNRMNGGEFRGAPPQMDNSDTTSSEADSNATTDSSDSASTNEGQDNEQMASPNRDIKMQSQSSFIKEIVNGLPGLVLNCLSIGLAAVWFVLSYVLRRKNRSVNP